MDRKDFFAQQQYPDSSLHHRVDDQCPLRVGKESERT